MPLFPFFMEIEGREGLIVGGGKHALEKVRRLLPYGPRLRVIAPEFMAALEESGERMEVELVRKRFAEEDLLEKPFFVVAADEDREENRRVALLCRKRSIPVNAVDDGEYCDFIFPSLIARGKLSVGICTGGASPATGVLLKRRMEEQIPENIEEILDFLQEKRPLIQKSISDKKKRYAFYYQLSGLCMEENRALTEEEFEKLLASQII